MLCTNNVSDVICNTDPQECILGLTYQDRCDSTCAGSKQQRKERPDEEWNLTKEDAAATVLPARSRGEAHGCQENAGEGDASADEEGGEHPVRGDAD